VRRSQAHCDAMLRFGGHRVELRQDDLESAVMDAPTFPLNQKIHEFGAPLSNSDPLIPPEKNVVLPLSS
jgi:hypothetical protein